MNGRSLSARMRAIEGDLELLAAHVGSLTTHLQEVRQELQSTVELADALALKVGNLRADMLKERDRK